MLRELLIYQVWCITVFLLDIRSGVPLLSTVRPVPQIVMPATQCYSPEAVASPSGGPGESPHECNIRGEQLLSEAGTPTDGPAAPRQREGGGIAMDDGPSDPQPILAARPILKGDLDRSSLADRSRGSA